MMKFASFETIVELIYKHSIPKPKDECSKSLQLGVSFAGGCIAGVFCAAVSHPADNLVSFLNNAKGASVGDVNFNLSPLCLILHFRYHVYCTMCPYPDTLWVLLNCAGCEEAWTMGSIYPWPSPSYSHDWNSYWCSVGHI